MMNSIVDPLDTMQYNFGRLSLNKKGSLILAALNYSAGYYCWLSCKNIEKESDWK